MRKSGRNGRLFVDTLRNGYAQHAARCFTIRDIGDRLADGDPWQGISRQARSLTRARNRLAKLIG